MPRNPSGTVAHGVASLPCWRIRGIECRCLVLPTSYAALDEIFEPRLADNYAAVLMIGVAGRSRKVRVESRALNRVSTLFPDASGVQPTRLAGRARPGSRRATFSPAAALAILRRHRVPARTSQDAGRYLCNAGYHRALAQTCPVLFIHIPKPPRVRPRRRALRQRLSWGDRLAIGFGAVAAQMLTHRSRHRAMRLSR